VRYETLEHEVDLPKVGVAARRLARFEREFARWIATSEGKYATWCARRAVEQADATARRQSS
jgi:hypothetical protein